MIKKTYNENISDVLFKILIVLLIALGIGVCAFAITPAAQPITETVTNIDTIHYKLDSCNIAYEKTKQSLIEEVDTYIMRVAPKSKVSGRALVEACLQYDVDISLVLAQGHHESHFGTAGIAARTNSVFNVNSYPGRSAAQIKKMGLGYATADASIEPYLKLLRNRYLVRGKTEQDLLRNFVDKNGHRYAGLGYESRINKIYRRLNETTSIPKKFNTLKSGNGDNSK